ncbi:hypothetical protein P8629_01440 [Hydrogenovibrio sp. 3SP14C1]|uniref:hypothetical protein n=1 Tax=Hydrogenovibrio sp. 3SP14C1 TaxID=3038774 RepID=UPI002416FE5E|nr:hypothetical protein [Hydrogenovibrio sp. 3SP14C1]MDG4811659.1 hypothetical protein [Hydrogenovibrio sp. 3SP14C1]
MTNDILNAIREKLKDVFTDLRSCEVHPGRFTLKELKSTSAKSPAARVSCLGTAKNINMANGQVKSEKQFVVYFVTKDKSGLSKDDAIRNLVDDMTLLLDSDMTRWLPGTGAPSNVKDDNLYSSEIDRQGVMLWAVSWRQTITLGDDQFIEDGTIPTEIYAGPNDGTYEKL